MGAINHVSFPNFGLNFTFCETVKIPFTNIHLYWYAIIIAAGMFTAIAIAFREFKKHSISTDDLSDFVLWAIPLGILGARCYYVIFEWDYYSKHLSKIAAIWEGGLAIYGGIIVGAIVAIVWCKLKKVPFLWFADVATCGLFIAQSMGRWGNFINAEAYGGATDLPWGMTVNGQGPVHPTFLYESLWNFVGFIISYFVIRRLSETDGYSFAYYLVWYGVGRFFIEGLRADSLYIFGNIRVSQVVAFVSIFIGMGVLFYIKSRKKSAKHEIKDD